jgi:hypothetical protein
MLIGGIILVALGCFMIWPSILLHRRMGYIVAPRPIVLVFVSIGNIIIGITLVILAALIAQ